MKHFRSVPMLARIIAAATICTAALAAAAPTPQAPSEPTAQAQAQSAFAAGYQAYQRGDLDAAISSLQAAAVDADVLGDYALYYLGQAQLARHNLDAAAASFTRLTARYPESVFAARSELALAKIALTQNHPEQARQHAQSALDMSGQASVQAPARLLLGRALTALGQPGAAYEQFQKVRRDYPHSSSDAAARALRKEVLRAHPEVADTSSLSYLSREAPLLLSEGQAQEAYFTAQEALALEPPASIRAAMLWVQAKSSRGQPERQERAFKSYLAVAPHGAKADDALYDLARLYWHRKDTAGARQYFRQLVASFPGSGLAAAAMLRIGRTYEDEDKFDSARSAYLQLAAARPHSAPAADARFRSVWLLYMGHSFAAAASGFESQKSHAADASERASYEYWRARSLEQLGQRATARDIFTDLASSTVTNYYPEMAGRRVGAPTIVLPVVGLDPPEVSPSAMSGRAAFHLRRALALKTMALFQLELGELRRLRAVTEDNRTMRLFLLAAFDEAGGYHDATVMATTMVAHGEISSRLAERLRYPRGYWSYFSQAAARTGVTPYLLLALTRQESLFDPSARSIADARGLMQLLPSTARKVAAQTGLSGSEIDLYDPTINIELGSANVKMMLKMFNGNEFRAIAAYNAGEDAVQRWDAEFSGPDDEWVENIDYGETRNYVKKVVGGMREYRMLYPPPKQSASNQ
jgi:peptidoglycan lytic transglycosylase